MSANPRGELSTQQSKLGGEQRTDACEKRVGTKLATKLGDVVAGTVHALLTLVLEKKAISAASQHLCTHQSKKGETDSLQVPVRRLNRLAGSELRPHRSLHGLVQDDAGHVASKVLGLA